MSSPSELPSGTVTFLFTDIEGSTRLVRILAERYQEVLHAYQELLRAVFVEYGGREIDTQGDSFFVAFRRARDAVNAAVAAQRALIAHDWPEGVLVKVRMGIHTGEPVVGEQRYTGLGVHRAARIGALGHGGQVLLSNTTRELIEDDLPAGVGLRDLGRYRLKDIQRPERVYQLVAEGLPPKFPPLKSAGRVARARRVGRKGAAVAAVVVGAVIAGAVVLLTRGGSDTAFASSVDPNTVGVIDAQRGTIAAQVTVGSAPSGVTAGADGVWVANSDAGTVSRIDPKSNSVRQEIDVGGGPSGVAVGGGAVWVANGLDGTVSRIDPAVNKVVATIQVGAGPSSVAWGEGAVWVANAVDGTVSQIDPKSWRVTRTFPAALDATAIAVGFARIWVVSQSSGAVVVLDPRSGEVEDRIGVGVDPDALAVGAGAVWVANRADGTVSKIEPRSRAVIKTIPVGRRPAAIAVGPDVVWIANSGDGTLSRVEPSRDAVNSTVSVANSPRGLGLTGDGLYVAVRSAGRARQGGTLRVMMPAFISDSIDPALSYNFPVLIPVYDGLVGFRRVGGVQGTQLVPDLAESLAIPTDNGKTYTFVLRRGLRYSSGRPVEPADFRLALERVLRLRSPAAPYYAAIVGASECLSSPKRCDLSRGIVTDPTSRTITFHLTEPDGEFQTKLALPFASAVPAGTPFRDVGSRPVPGTGPYRISRWVKRKLVTLVRSAAFQEWSPDAQPEGSADVISWRAELSSKKRVRALERGSVDVVSIAVDVSKEQLANIASRYPGRLRVSTSPETEFLFMNTRVSPFDDVRVRRAVNLALDRDQIVRRLGEYTHVATCQVLPPNTRAFRRTCPYTGGLAAARRLVAQSGKKGQRVVVWFPPPLAETGRYVVSILNQLGFHASLKVVGGAPAAYFGTVGDSRRRVQIGFSGWAADYPSPAGFLRPLFSCAGFVPANAAASTNWAEFCDPEVDLLLKTALALQTENPPAATIVWLAAERAVLARAPIAPMWNGRQVDFVSSRLGNYQFNPEFGFLLGQARVK
jgi:YVTN family beta-propeller protein